MDATDNRLTIKSMDENTPLEAIQELTKYLDQTFGAKQIFVVPKTMQEKFKHCGFKFVDPENKNDRIRETSFESLANINSEQFLDLEFVHGDVIKNTDKENILDLMRKSKFLESKIKQYEMQEYNGFKLMCDYSMPFGVKDKSGKLVAFCRITDLGNGNYYLGDTFVDERAFGNKQKGTAYLYQQLGAECKAKFGGASVLLIAPPGMTDDESQTRVNEFENTYGCKAPQNVLFKFGAAKPELENVFKDEKTRIEKELEKTSTQSFGKT